MQPQMAVALGLSRGTSIVTESIFENRFRYVDELTRMGASIKVEGNTAIINGVDKYTGASMSAPDLRAGAALVMAYRITPFNTTQLNARIDSEKMYDNLMHKFKFGNIAQDDIYLDETIMRMSQTHRRMFIQLASQLIKEGKNDKALKALDYCQEVIPSKNVPHDFIMSSSKEMADDYIALGEIKKAETILDELANKAIEYITWYMSLDDEKLALSYENCINHFYMMDQINKSFAQALTKAEENQDEALEESSETAMHYAQRFEELYHMFNERVGRK